jgi:hypothetical protein
MTVGEWLFLLEQYALSVGNEGLVIHPETVLRWIESVRRDGHDD